MSHDRVGRDKFDFTQEFLAEMLGVRRPGVTVAMGLLEKAGLISHGQGTSQWWIAPDSRKRRASATRPSWADRPG